MMLEEARREPCPQIMTLRVEQDSNLVPPRVGARIEDLVEHRAYGSGKVERVSGVMHQNAVSGSATGYPVGALASGIPSSPVSMAGEHTGNWSNGSGSTAEGAHQWQAASQNGRKPHLSPTISNPPRGRRISATFGIALVIRIRFSVQFFGFAENSSSPPPKPSLIVRRSASTMP